MASVSFRSRMGMMCGIVSTPFRFSLVGLYHSRLAYTRAPAGRLRGGCSLLRSLFPVGALGGGAGGAPLDQLPVQQQAADGHPVRQGVQGVVAAFAQLEPVLPDGGQGLGRVRAEGQVVEADDAQLV